MGIFWQITSSPGVFHLFSPSAGRIPYLKRHLPTAPKTSERIERVTKAMTLILPDRSVPENVFELNVFASKANLTHVTGSMIDKFG